jgi:Na+/H+-dicarboxylate symporter
MLACVAPERRRELRTATRGVAGRNGWETAEQGIITTPNLGGVMTVVLIVCAVLALIVLAVILAGHGHALRTAPKRIRASRPYRRPRSPDG